MRKFIVLYFTVFLLFKPLYNLQAQSSFIQDSIAIENLNTQSVELVYSEPKEALKKANQALNLANKIGFIRGIASSYGRIGIYYDVVGKFDSAIFYYKKALKLHSKIKNKKGIGACYSNLGLTYLNKSDYYNALSHFQAAIKPLEDIKLYLFLGNCYNNIGLLYYEMSSYDKSIFNFQKAISFYDSSDNQIGKANVYSNLSNVYSELKRFDTCIVLEKASISIYEKHNDLYNVGKSYNNLGLLYSQTGDQLSGIEMVKKAMLFNQENENSNALADNYGNLAMMYDLLKDSKSSKIYLKKAEPLIPEITNPKIKNSILVRIADIYKSEGNFKKASLMYREAISLKDSFLQSDLNAKIAKLEAQFGLERKENENNILKTNNIIQKLELKNKEKILQNRKRNIYTIAFFSILTITVVFLYLKRRQLIEQYRNETRLKAIQHKQRLDISHELHDNVGAQLTYLSSHLKLLSEKDPNNNKIISLLEASNEAILSLRETVWALNNEHITLTDFSDKFKSFAYKIHPINPNIRYKIKENFVHEYTLQPIQALNLFRLCQEAFCNALKHSKAKNINILFSNSEECAFCIEIKDDGIGFDINGIKENGHFGLENMKSRADEIGVIFDLKSQIDQGTSISIKLKNS